MINIIEYNKGFEEDVKDLLTQLQEFVVKIDKEKLNIIAENYREEYFKKTYTEVYSNQGKIFIAEEDGKLVWECPHCKNRDQNKMNVARRTCGYIGTQFWNQGRTQEIKDRVLHL